MTNRQVVMSLKIIIHSCAFLPVLYFYYLAITGEIGADPVEAMIHFTGIGALNLLLITLCVSPVAKWTRRGYLLQTRRLLGLYSFFYALLHVLNFLAFEIQFDISLFISEVIVRPYITVGMLAFLLLFALAFTSIKSIKMFMGRRWQKLHNSIYFLTLLILLHYAWSMKSSLFLPLVYTLLTLVLLALRYKKIKKWF